MSAAKLENLMPLHSNKPTFSIRWTIRNFRSINNPENSPKFPASSPRYSLRLKESDCLYERICDEDNDEIDYYEVFEYKTFIWLRNERPSHEQNANLYWCVSLVNDKGQRCLTQEGQAVFRDGHTSPFCFDSLTIRSELLVKDKLYIYCEVFDLNDDPYSRRNKHALISICTNNQTLLDSGKFADVTLVVGDRQFKSHKLILSAQSPVFAAMFQQDCIEKRESKVTIPDVSAEVFQELLGYIYSAKTPALDKFAQEMLAVADKYQLDELKSLCGKYLSSKLDPESVIGHLYLADMYRVAVLKSRCIKYMVCNIKEVIATDQWKEFVGANRSDLMAELVKKLANQVKC